MNYEVIALILFAAIFLFLMTGYPVAFVLGGLSVIVGIIFVPDFWTFFRSGLWAPFRITYYWLYLSLFLWALLSKSPELRKNY